MFASTPGQYSYSCTALKGTNKTGVLRPDADGYYTVVLGALNFFNSAGAYYPLEPAKELFEGSSILMRRVNDGALSGECGHPRPDAYRDRNAWFNRIMDIYEPNISHHIRKVWLDYGEQRDANGRPVVLVIGEIRPAGPMGGALREALENPYQNVCFSVRCFSRDDSINSITHKAIKQIVTWDWVNEPGISKAKKWNAPGLESIGEIEVIEDRLILPTHLMAVRDMQRQRGVGMESTSGITAQMLLEQFGWEKQEVLNAAPASQRW